MPWDKNDYPPSMKNLKSRVRSKAIEIANALLNDGYEEGRSIAIATAQAEEWNENHPEGQEEEHKQNSSKANTSSRKKEENSNHSGEYRNLHVVPHEDGWAVRKEGKDTPEHTYEVKEDAVEAAKQMVASKNIRLIIHDKQGKIQTSKIYN